MPLREYRCLSCIVRKNGRKNGLKTPFTFEKIEAWGQEPVTECPQCGGEVVRTFGVPAFHFKGGAPSHPQERTVKQGKHTKHIHRAPEGHWEQDGIMGAR